MMNLENFQEGHADPADATPEEQMVFHYKREDRIKKAPQIVKDFYDGKLTAYRPGLFKALVSTRANKFMLLTLVICFAVVVMLGFFYRRDQSTLNGVPLTLTSFSFEENVYVSLCFENPEKKYRKEGPVPASVHLEFLDADKQPVEKRDMTHIYMGKESFLRTTFHDYDIFFIKADVKFNDGVTSLISNVEKR